jgi:pimeloyl-ACP methyl ester carboxylesterase
MKKTISTLLAATIAVSSLASCEKNDETLPVKTNTYVLVHGAWQAPYVWETVKADLTKKGNKVIVVELPGHGKDSTATHTLSMDVYRDKVVEAISAVNEKVILIGHSMGGMVVSAVAEKIPSRISKLVCIGAFLPANGQALVDLANTDAGSKLGPLLIESPDRLTLDVKEDSLTYLFINDGNAAEKKLVIDNYRAEPAIPFINKLVLTSENFGAVSKLYIKTLQDVVISPALQDRMIAAAGIKDVHSINAGHSPFLSQPKAVADLLLGIGQ